jgi:hypothetical protein
VIKKYLIVGVAYHKKGNFSEVGVSLALVLLASVQLGLHERRTGIVCVDDDWARGRQKTD